MIRFQPLLACSHAAIFIGLSEPFSTLLVASFLDRICFAFFFHKSEFSDFGLVRQAFLMLVRPRVEQLP
jgi:hypothetical protein